MATGWGNESGPATTTKLVNVGTYIYTLKIVGMCTSSAMWGCVHLKWCVVWVCARCEVLTVVPGKAKSYLIKKYPSI